MSRKSYEELAFEIVKCYVDVRKAQNKDYYDNRLGMHHDFGCDYEINSLYNIANQVKDIANQLSRNAIDRANQYDLENFDKELIKMLEGE